ncbi:MAG: NAD-dependent epimerase/dehydratase family protein [Gemmatimonadaceae bacterium]
MSRHALVTGATGLVGSHLTAQLADAGWTVRALVRDPRRAAWLRELGASDLARGDVLDGESFTAAAAGCDVVFHAAAAITPAAGDWESYRATNIGGTAAAIDAARTSGARLLHVSSVAVYGPQGRYRADGQPTTEDLPMPPIPEHAFYARSKRESEQLVMAAHERGEIWATAVRPDVIYGKRDRQFIPRMATLLSRFHAFPLPGGGKNTLAIINAASVADAAIRAATSDIAGGRAYNIANEGDTTLRDFVELAATGLGTVVLRIPVPLGIVGFGLAAAQRMWKAFHLPGSEVLQHASLNFVSRDNPFSSARAERELGWSPVVAPVDAIPDAFRWWARERRR